MLQRGVAQKRNMYYNENHVNDEEKAINHQKAPGPPNGHGL